MRLVAVAAVGAAAGAALRTRPVQAPAAVAAAGAAVRTLPVEALVAAAAGAAVDAAAATVVEGAAVEAVRLHRGAGVADAGSAAAAAAQVQGAVSEASTRRAARVALAHCRGPLRSADLARSLTACRSVGPCTCAQGADEVDRETTWRLDILDEPQSRIRKQSTCFRAPIKRGPSLWCDFQGSYHS